MGGPAIAQGFVALAGTALELQDNQVQDMQRRIDADTNERLARRAAADAVVRGKQEAARTRMAATQMIARQQVGFAASGVDATVGTPADVAAGTRALSELDALTIQNNAAREAWGYTTKADQIRRQAKLDELRYQGRQLGTALGGVGRVGSVYAGEVGAGRAPGF